MMTEHEALAARFETLADTLEAHPSEGSELMVRAYRRCARIAREAA